MTEFKTAVQFKMNSIQEYIFTSNRLKENIGASQITDQEVYKCMNTILNNHFEQKHSIGDSGGGGAIILFDKEENGIEFIRKFSRELLLKFPGLKTSFALKEKDFNYQTDKEKLSNLLTDNRSRYSVNNSIQKHGITADCPLSNETAEIYLEEQYISNVSYSKIQAAESAINNYKQILDVHSKYTLTTEIDKLGQNKEASYIAVVHIDGNGMGSKISAISSLEDLASFSNKVKKATKESMDKVILNLIHKFNESDTFDGIKLRKEGDKFILPIRPLLSGGDDITFVCEGRLGMYLAEQYIKYFTENGTSVLMNGACAGVAIVKTKFPFYKAYQLAEELCKEAKEKSRGTKDSYLSFYYSATTFSGSLEQLRARTHKLSNQQSLYFGPYNIFGISESNSIEKLKAGVKYLGFQRDDKGDPSFPKNKVMRLRKVIIESHSSQELFLKELLEAEIKLPAFGDKLYTKPELWKKDKTPYFDQIELMDFYLEELL